MLDFVAAVWDLHGVVLPDYYSHMSVSIRECGKSYEEGVEGVVEAVAFY